MGRYSPDRVYSLCYYDQGQQYYYMKRFTAELSDKMQDFLDPGGPVRLRDGRSGAKLEITSTKGLTPRVRRIWSTSTSLVGVKSHRAKGQALDHLQGWIGCG